MTRRALSVCIAAMLLLPALAVSGEDEALKQEIAQSDLHDIMSNRITDAVTRMEILLHDHSRNEQELERERKHEAGVIADSAVELQHSVELVLALQPKLAIAPDQAPKFVGYATTLKTQAQELEALARQNRYEALMPAHERMKGTCMACHRQFRGY